MLPKAIDFGNVAVEAAEERRFIVKNAGNQVLTGTLTLSNPQEFSILGSAPAFSIPIGGQREWTIRFTPRSEGPLSGTLRMGGTEVPLSGIGVVK